MKIYTAKDSNRHCLVCGSMIRKNETYIAHIGIGRMGFAHELCLTIFGRKREAIADKGGLL